MFALYETYLHTQRNTLRFGISGFGKYFYASHQSYQLKTILERVRLSSWFIRSHRGWPLSGWKTSVSRCAVSNAVIQSSCLSVTSATSPTSVKSPRKKALRWRGNMAANSSRHQPRLLKTSNGYLLTWCGPFETPQSQKTRFKRRQRRKRRGASYSDSVSFLSLWSKAPRFPSLIRWYHYALLMAFMRMSFRSYMSPFTLRLSLCLVTALGFFLCCWCYVFMLQIVGILLFR